MEFELTLTSYGLSENLLLRAHGVGTLDGRGEVSWSCFPTSIGSTIADSVASQSNYSLLTVSGFAPSTARVDTVQLGGSKPLMIASRTQGTHSTGALNT